MTFNFFRYDTSFFSSSKLLILVFQNFWRHGVRLFRDDSTLLFILINNSLGSLVTSLFLLRLSTSCSSSAFSLTGVELSNARSKVLLTSVVGAFGGGVFSYSTFLNSIFNYVKIRNSSIDKNCLNLKIVHHY